MKFSASLKLFILSMFWINISTVAAGVQGAENAVFTYSFDAEQDDIVHIIVHATSLNFDPILIVKNLNDIILDQNDDHQPGNSSLNDQDSELFFVAPSTDRYVIEVTGYEGTHGTFELILDNTVVISGVIVDGAAIGQARVEQEDVSELWKRLNVMSVSWWLNYTGDGWNELAVDLGFVNTGDELLTLPTFQVNEIVIETEQGVTYSAELYETAVFPSIFSGAKLADSIEFVPLPPRLPILTVHKDGTALSRYFLLFRFAPAASLTQAVIRSGEAELIVPLRREWPEGMNVQNPLPEYFGFQSLNPQQLSSLFKELNPDLNVRYRACLEFGGAYALQYDVVNSNTLQEETITVPHGFWYSNGTYYVEDDTLLTAGPAHRGILQELAIKQQSFVGHVYGVLAYMLVYLPDGIHAFKLDC